MATVTNWNPFGVAFDITATAGTVTRTSATRYTVKLTLSWKTTYSGNATSYGMWVYPNDLTYPDGLAITDYNANVGSGSKTITATYSISGTGKQTKTLSIKFENWYPNAGSASKSISLNVTVPALATYSIKYNANGGTGAPSSQTKYYGTAIKLSSTKPTRTGYTFSKWTTASNGSGTAYASGANYTANASVTLYAQWTINKYTVTYNANGGTGAPASQTANYNTTITISNTVPTRSPNGDTEYVFKGWATTKDATTASYKSGSSYVVKSNVTMYAVWGTKTAEWDVVYDANGGTNAPGNQVKNKDVALVLSNVIPIRTGYNFGGWAINPNSTIEAYVPGASYEVNDDLYLYAIWIPFVHTVTFNLQGGINAPADFTSTYGDVHVISNTETKTIIDEVTGEEIQVEVDIEPEKHGYVFEGWNTSSDGNGKMYKFGDVYEEYQDGGILVLYACWVDKSILIYKNGACHCIGFKETNNNSLSFNNNGFISAYEFVEGDCVKISSNGFVFTELIEK